MTRGLTLPIRPLSVIFFLALLCLPPPARAADSGAYIPAGAEQKVQNWLGPLVRSGFAGHKVNSISIQNDEVRIILISSSTENEPRSKSCPSPKWAETGSALILGRRATPDDRFTPPVTSERGFVEVNWLRLGWFLCQPGQAPPVGSGRQSTEVDEHGGTPRAVNVGGAAPSLAPALPVATVRDEATSLAQDLSRLDPATLWQIEETAAGPAHNVSASPWPLFLGCFILAIVGLVPRLRRHSQLGIVISAPFFALGIRDLFQASWIWILWLVIIVMAGAAYAGVARPRKTTTWIALGFVVLALATRWVVESVPSNWYVDFHSVHAAGQDSYQRVPGGFSFFFRALSHVIDVSPSFIFGFSIFCSSLGVGLLFLTSAFLTERGETAWPGRIGLLWGLLLSLDGLLARVGASDAPHNIVLLAFAAGWYWFCRRALAPYPEKSSWVGGSMDVGVFSCAVLIGTTRTEQILTPLFWPLLVIAAGGHLGWKLWIRRSIPAVVGVAAATWIVWVREPLGYAGEFHPHTMGQWGEAVVAQMPWSCHLGFVEGGIAILLTAFFAISVWRRPRIGFVLVCYAVFAGVKILGGFGLVPVGQFGAGERYDVIQGPLLLLMFACGVSDVWGLLRSKWSVISGASRSRSISTGVLIAFGIFVASGNVVESVLHRPKETHQIEYGFLQRCLPQVDANARVATAWLEGMETKFENHPLAVRNFVVLTMRPDIAWMDAESEAERNGRPEFFFFNTACNYDAGRGGGDGESAEEILRACRRLEQRVAEWTCSETVEVTGGNRSLRSPSIVLRVGRMPR